MADTEKVLAEARAYLATIVYAPLTDAEAATERTSTEGAQHQNDMENLAKAEWEDPLFELLHEERLPAARWIDVFEHLADTVLTPKNSRQAA